MAASAEASPAKAPSSPGSGAGTTKTISKQLQLFVTPTVRPKEEVELKRLVRAVKAIEDKGVRMTKKRRLRIAKAALKTSKQYGVDATLLIAVARMESDFRGLQVVSWKCRSRRFSHCVADCGITQHYISGRKKWVIHYCRRLANNYTLSFSKSAKELAHHIKWCNKRAKSRWHKPLRRCVLNRYNSGTFYRTARRCSRRWSYCMRWNTPKLSWVYEKGITKIDRRYRQRQYVQRASACTRVKYKCLRRAAYWKTVMCFDYGARNGIRAKRSCRRMGRCVNRRCRRRWDLRDIPTVFYGRPTRTASK